MRAVAMMLAVLFIFRSFTGTGDQATCESTCVRRLTVAQRHLSRGTSPYLGGKRMQSLVGRGYRDRLQAGGDALAINDDPGLQRLTWVPEVSQVERSAEHVTAPSTTPWSSRSRIGIRRPWT
jgi:hypothetical protein